MMMRIRMCTTTALAVGALAFGLPRLAAAQDSVKSTITGAAEIGNRDFLRSLEPQYRAKFEQYRSVPSGLLFQQFFIRYTPSDSLPSVQLSGHDLGQLDQSLYLDVSKPRKLDFQVRWDQIPHTFSTDARMLGTEATPGVFVLPNPRPDTATLNRSGYLAPVATRWDPLKMSLALTSPNTAWDFKSEYTRTAKNGERPMGMAMGGSSNNAREILEPIDQTVHDLRISQSYSKPKYQVVVAYGLSDFVNALQSVTSDNPLVTVDSLKLGTARGRTALAPSNIAQSLTGTGAINLPRHSRLTGTVSYSWRDQNQALIPVTINSKNADSLTRAGYVFPTSANAKVQTTMANLSFNSRPLPTLTLSARYRMYDFKDKTPEDSVPILVISDRTFAAGASREGFSSNRNTADVSASWRYRSLVSLTAGYNWDWVARDSVFQGDTLWVGKMNVIRATEKTPKVSVDFMGLDWLALHASYSDAVRRGTTYYQTVSSENPDARRFFEADRDLTRTSFLATLTPIDQVSIMGNLDLSRTSYPHSTYGVQKDNSTSYGGEIDYSPSARFSIGGGYVHENYDNTFNGLYRTGSTPATLANPTWAWIAANTDQSDVASVNFTADIIPNRLEAGGLYELSRSRFLLGASNPTTPAGGTASQNLAATAMDFPEVRQELQPWSIYLRYRVLPEWALTMRYQHEVYDGYDFRTSGLAPATGNYVFLGNDIMNYTASYLTVMMSFHPTLLKRARSAM